MKVRKVSGKVNLEKEFIVGFDVGSQRINGYAEHLCDGEKLSFEEEFKNMTYDIKSALRQYCKHATSLGYERLKVVCEPTGGYEKMLLDIAEDMGFLTAYVSGESVSKLGIVGTNDYGKTDSKDPRTITYLAKTGCCLTRRTGEDIYKRMKLLNRMYNEEDRSVVAAKNLFYSYLKDLFWDNRRSNSFYFNTKLGQLLVRDFKCSPFRMRELGYKNFCSHVKAKIKVRKAYLDELWDDVVSSCDRGMDEQLRSIYEGRLDELYGDWEKHDGKKKKYMEQIDGLFRQTKEYEKLKGIMTQCGEGNLARLVAETGSLSDFGCADQFLKYAGLNITEKKSGKFIGKMKISKRGNSLLRKVLYQICCFRMTRSIFRDYYREAKERLRIPIKAVISVMRKFLKMILGIVKSSSVFDENRIFVSQGDFKKVA